MALLVTSGTVTRMRTNRSLPRTHHHAFSLVELIVVIIILGLIAAIALPDMQGVMTNTNEQLGTVHLLSVSTAEHGAANTDAGTFSPTPSTVSVVGVTLTTGAAPSGQPPTASVGAASTATPATTLIYAIALSPSSCLVLVDPMSAAQTWGIDTQTPAGSCSASAASSVQAQITSTSPTQPSNVAL